MRKIILLLAALAYAGFGSAQNIVADTLPALPPYVYCEIIADHLPSHRENGVLFTLKLDLQHNGLKFVPLQPPIRAATVLVWKKNRVLSPLTNAFLDFAKKYISGMEKDKK